MLKVLDDILVDTQAAASKSTNWKYVALAVSTLAAFFLIIRLVSEPVEPIIIMSEPATITHLATVPATLEGTEVHSPPSLPDNTSNPVLLPNESMETLPSSASLTTENDTEKEVVTNDSEKSAIKTDVATMDKTPQELLDIELAKKKARQKAKKKAEEAAQQSLKETTPQAESQPQQSIVVQQKAPEVVATEAKKDTTKATTKEAVKPPSPEKSPWSKFTDSIKQGGEIPCSPAQIAMNQCS